MAPVGGGSTSAVDLLRRYIESLPQQAPFRKEVKSGHFWRAVWTEFLVSLLFLVVGCGAGVRWSGNFNRGTSTVSTGCNISSESSTANGCSLTEDLKASLALGLTVVALVHSTAHISGCHMNPAVSITLLVTRTITPLRMVSYVLAQCLGATVGAGILYGLMPIEVRQTGLLPTTLHPSVHPSQAFGVEFLITLLVSITLIASNDCGQNEPKGFMIGVAYTVGHLFAYRYTGGGMNPARSLALAFITNTWSNHWVYWVGPILGGIIGGITYEYIRDPTTGNYNGYFYPYSHYQHSWRCSQREVQELKRDISALSSRDACDVTAVPPPQPNDLRL